MVTTPCHPYRGLNFDDYPDAFASTDPAIPDGFLYPRWQNKNYTARVKRGGVWIEEQRVSKADVRYQNDGKV